MSSQKNKQRIDEDLYISNMSVLKICLSRTGGYRMMSCNWCDIVRRLKEYVVNIEHKVIYTDISILK